MGDSEFDKLDNTNKESKVFGVRLQISDQISYNSIAKRIIG